MPSRGGAAARARADLEAGRPWLARDRLRSAVRDRPADQELLDLLGEVQNGFGDLPAAGAAWFLTDRDDEPARAARAALAERFAGRPAATIAALKVRAPIEAFPPAAQRRLRRLQADAAAAGMAWDPAPRPRAPRPEVPEPSRLGTAVAGTVAVALVGLLLLGLGTAAVLLWRLAT